MIQIHPSHALVFLFSLCCVSCGDDPVMVEKRDQQKREITRLKGEFALIEEKLKSLPPDVSGELELAKNAAAKQSAEVKQLEAEVAELETRKRAIQADFESYQNKYRIK
jgi:molecular chaperone GrpE (heat shock protein)